MHAHRFDPVSAVFAVAALALGVFTVSGTIDPFADADLGAWLAVAGIAVAIALFPWARRSAPEAPVEAVDSESFSSPSVRPDQTHGEENGTLG